MTPGSPGAVGAQPTNVGAPEPLEERPPELNLVQLEVSQVKNRVKAFEAVGTPCTKAQRQERTQHVGDNSSSVWLKHKEQKGGPGWCGSVD